MSTEHLKPGKGQTKEELEAKVNELMTDMLPVQVTAIQSCPSQYRLQYARALKYGTNAMKLKCMECVGFEDVKERVGGCTVSRCPLWSSRPFQKGDAE